MGTLTRDQILAVDDLIKEKITVKEWGGEVYVRTMTAEERDDLEQSIFAGKSAQDRMKQVRARICAMCIVDENGQRLFTHDDIPKLARKSAKVINVLFDRARSLNGILQADVEEITKNSEPSPRDDSTST